LNTATTSSGLAHRRRHPVVKVFAPFTTNCGSGHILDLHCKREALRLCLNNGSLSEKWGGVTKIAAAEMLTATGKRRFERCKQYLCISWINVKKII
jgi:hypothetical protein